MGAPNPAFKQNYESDLHQLNGIDFSLCRSTLGISVDEETMTAETPFFNKMYRVSRFGVVVAQEKRPDYGICVVLLKYLLMCPRWLPSAKDWIPYRDFKDSGQMQNTGLSDYATRTISKRYAGNLSRLKASVAALGGASPEVEYPYDLSAVISRR